MNRSYEILQLVLKGLVNSEKKAEHNSNSHEFPDDTDDSVEDKDINLLYDEVNISESEIDRDCYEK